MEQKIKKKNIDDNNNNNMCMYICARGMLFKIIEQSI